MYNLKYFFNYYADRDTRVLNGSSDLWDVEILQLDFADMPSEIQAAASPVIINYSNTSDNKYEAFRGSEATLNLIATDDFDLEDLYTENEIEFVVKIYRNNSLVWQGYIIPDNCQETFSFAPYVVSVNCVEGLGLLKNYSFVQDDGNLWLGRFSFLDVIYKCLNRVSPPDMELYTSVNIYEVSMLQGNYYDPLNLTFVNAERYVKEDGFTPMDCQEVLLSVLQEWTSCIIESEGAWYIFRNNEIAVSGTIAFRKYLDGMMSYDSGVVTKDLDVKLGGESEGVVLAPLFHINVDQLKMIDRPYKNASISYRYGLAQTLIGNPSLTWTPGPFGEELLSWLLSDPGLVISSDALGGTRIDQLNLTAPYAYIYNEDPVTASEGDILVVTINYYNFYADGPRAILVLTDGIDTYYADTFGQWQTIAYYLVAQYTTPFFEGSFVRQLDPLPITGDLTLQLFQGTDEFVTPGGSPIAITYRRADLSPVVDAEDPLGEIHTATQDNSFSFVPQTLNVFNGDGNSEQFIGVMYLDDADTLTSLWVRRGLSESVLAQPFSDEKPFLRIAVEEIVRMYASPFTKFEGSIFGYFNPLSRFSINLLDGKFVPLSLTYDTQANICKAVLATVSNTEIAQEYTLAGDYGETTKVTIK